MMSPLNLEIILHYHCISDDFRDGDFRAPAVRDSLSKLTREGLLTLTPEAPGKPKYAITDRGRAFVGQLCDTPLPVQVWAPADHPAIKRDWGVRVLKSDRKESD